MEERVSKIITCSEPACISMPVRADAKLDTLANLDLRRRLHEVRLLLSSQKHPVVLIEYLITRLEKLYVEACERFEDEQVMLYVSEHVGEVVRLGEDSSHQTTCADHFDVSPFVAGSENSQKRQHFKLSLGRQH